MRDSIIGAISVTVRGCAWDISIHFYGKQTAVPIVYEILFKLIMELLVIEKKPYIFLMKLFEQKYFI